MKYQSCHERLALPNRVIVVDQSILVWKRSSAIFSLGKNNEAARNGGQMASSRRANGQAVLAAVIGTKLGKGVGGPGNWARSPAARAGIYNEMTGD